MDRHARTQRHTYTHAHIHTRDIKCVPPQNVMPQDVAIGFVLAVITQGTHYVAIGAFEPSYLCLNRLVQARVNRKHARDRLCVPASFRLAHWPHSPLLHERLTVQ